MSEGLQKRWSITEGEVYGGVSVSDVDDGVYLPFTWSWGQGRNGCG